MPFISNYLLVTIGIVILLIGACVYNNGPMVYRVYGFNRSIQEEK